jgi:hypothetical protein
MVCNPTRQAGSQTQHGSHIYTQVGCGHDRHLLRLSPHMSLMVDLVAEEPNTWKKGTEKTHSYHTEIKGRLYRTLQVYQSAERIYTYPAWTRKETCKCQITQYSYMQNIITHTLVRATVVSTSGRARVSWLFDVSIFMVLTSQNQKMRRNWSIGTTSVHILIPISKHMVCQ